jgi:hypothetical protein
MAEGYHVTTPLGGRTCDDTKAVWEFIDQYMRQADARLDNVDVKRHPDLHNLLGAGEILVAADFWPKQNHRDQPTA